MPLNAKLSRRRFVAASCAATLCAAPLRAAPRLDPPLYTAEKDGARVYIFGGAVPKDRRWLTPTVKAAILDSDELWQEDPPTPSTFNRELNIELGQRKEGKLFDDFTPEQQARISEMARQLDVPLDTLQQMRPWAAGSVIAALDFPRHMSTYRPDDAKGVVMKMFTDRNLPIHSEVDQWDDWVRFYAAFPKPAAIQYMLYQIDLAELPRDRFPRWSEEWLHGDLSGWEGFNRHLATAYPDLYRELEVKRNAKWAERLAAMLDRGGGHFIHVGIQHTVGPDSIEAKALDTGIAVRRV